MMDLVTGAPVTFKRRHWRLISLLSFSALFIVIAVANLPVEQCDNGHGAAASCRAMSRGQLFIENATDAIKSFVFDPAGKAPVL